jgi:hypothetical protein
MAFHVRETELFPGVPSGEDGTAYVYAEIAIEAADSTPDRMKEYLKKC